MNVGTQLQQLNHEVAGLAPHMDHAFKVYAASNDPAHLEYYKALVKMGKDSSSFPIFTDKAGAGLTLKPWTCGLAHKGSAAMPS
ncbi:g887 [Coccomyxa viridis]|uniref:G887 protein n=1 Tax=Coccomyxa viridis TaxID=1274662 RepID=A0ABP1FGR7_9CHLO